MNEEAPRPEFPRVIQIRQDHGEGQLWIDGQLFPWPISPDVRPILSRGHMPSVTITLMADRVQVDHEVRWDPALPTPEYAWDTPEPDVQKSTQVASPAGEES